MNDIQVFILKSEQHKSKKFPPHVGLEDCFVGSKRQLSDLEICHSVDIVNEEELPTKIDAKLVSIFYQNSLLTNKYFLSVTSLANLYPNFSVLCGDISTELLGVTNSFFVNKMSEHYKQYSLNKYSNNLVSEISEELENLPPSYNFTINCSSYNSIGGYAPIRTPRGRTVNNRNFVIQAASLGDVIHSESLNTKILLSEEDLSVSNICKYFYDLGFLAAINIKNEDGPHYETIWKQFIETPESLDHKVLGRIGFDDTIPETEKRPFAEKFSMIRCSYQCGLFEGLSGIKIL
jgi:hypothetical protein